MYFRVSNCIDVFEPTTDFAAWCKANLTVKNPDFYKKQAMGRWTGNVPRNIVLYEKLSDRLRLPFGCIGMLYATYHDKCEFYNDIHSGDYVCNYNSMIKPYPYQEQAILDAINKRNGVIVMPCGSGKTQTGLELVSRLAGRCLWLTHTQDLLTQSMNRAKANFGISGGDYGTITAGKVNIGKMITFATVQTMCNINLSEYKDFWDVIVVDECHKCIGSPTKVMQFYKVLSTLSARFKYGLTATPKRSDGLEKSMFALLGGIAAKVDKSAVKEYTCDIVVETVSTGYKPDTKVILNGDGTINYSSVVNDLVENQERFNLVLNTINEIGSSVLVLANRVEYLQRLSDSFSGRSICLSGLSMTKTNRLARKEALRQLNEGELDCIFATYQLAKEGLDVPTLKYVVFATPEKDETTVIQSAGRVGRKAPGKEFGTVIDFVDDFGMYYGWAKKRQNYYKKLT